MTCKDCIHYNVCGLNEYKDFNEICSFFKDKSRIVELPCKIGDKVHKIIKSNIFGNHIQDMTIKKFDLIAHTDFEVIDQWNSIYFTKEEVEAKLKELEK